MKGRLPAPSWQPYLPAWGLLPPLHSPRPSRPLPPWAVCQQVSVLEPGPARRGCLGAWRNDTSAGVSGLGWAPLVLWGLPWAVAYHLQVPHSPCLLPIPRGEGTPGDLVLPTEPLVSPSSRPTQASRRTWSRRSSTTTLKLPSLTSL